MDNQVTATSKFLSFVLRHQLRAIGITLDHEGSATWKTLIAAATASGQSLDRSQVEAVVQDNDKKRFSISADGQRIRQPRATRQAPWQSRRPADAATTAPPDAFLSRSRLVERVPPEFLAPLAK